MDSQQAEFLRNVFVTSLTNEQPVTRRVIEAIPVDAANAFKHDAVAKTPFELAAHIVRAEHMFMNAVADGQFDFTIALPESIKTTTEVAEWYGKHFPSDVERLKGLSGDALLKVVDFRGLFQLPAVMYLQFSVSHSIHHRGQLSMYLRPMGAKVPSIYGESFDATQARLQATGG